MGQGRLGSSMRPRPKLSPLTKKVAVALCAARDSSIEGVRALGPSSKVSAAVPGTEQPQMSEPGASVSVCTVGAPEKRYLG